MRTTNDPDNPAMLAVNAKLGYVLVPGRLMGRAAQELLDRYQAILDHWEQYLMTKTDDDLHRPIHHAPEAAATLRWPLWHLAEHNIGHQNQMVWLKKWVRQGKA